MKKQTVTRRELIKKAQYIPPLILTLTAAPSFAKSGSEKAIDLTFKPKRPRRD